MSKSASPGGVPSDCVERGECSLSFSDSEQESKKEDVDGHSENAPGTLVRSFVANVRAFCRTIEIQGTQVDKSCTLSLCYLQEAALHRVWAAVVGVR